MLTVITNILFKLHPITIPCILNLITPIPVEANLGCSFKMLPLHICCHCPSPTSTYAESSGSRGCECSGWTLLLPGLGMVSPEIGLEHQPSPQLSSFSPPLLNLFITTFITISLHRVMPTHPSQSFHLLWLCLSLRNRIPTISQNWWDKMGLTWPRRNC